MKALVSSSQLHKCLNVVVGMCDLAQIVFNLRIADLVNVCMHGIYALCTIWRLEHTLPPRFECAREAFVKCSSLQCQ